MEVSSRHMRSMGVYGDPRSLATGALRALAANSKGQTHCFRVFGLLPTFKRKEAVTGK